MRLRYVDKIKTRDAKVVPSQAKSASQRALPEALARRRASRLGPEMRLSELLDAWSHARQPSPKTLDGANRAISQFQDLFGDIAASAITADDLFDYRDMLTVLPRTLSSAERQLGFARLAAHYSENRIPGPRVASTTVLKQLRHIQTLLIFAFQERWISDDVSRHIPVVADAGNKRRAFARAEVRAIFRLPIFINPWSNTAKRQISNETIRWIMLIGLTSGARLEEIGQLQPTDIKTEDNIVYMSIDDADAFGEKCATKSIKNASSKRRVPIHSDLLKLGLQERSTRLRRDRAERLFPDLPIDEWGRYTRNASRTCNRLIDRVTRDPSVVFHSFRHFFKDMCREAGMLESVSDQLTGHAPRTVGGRYGSGVSLAELKLQLERLRFEFIDWSKIYTASRL